MHNITFSWAVIGAGPAGIAAIGKLIDAGIDPKKIVWIDPAFNVGDFGTRWRKVSSNTRVGLFTQFFANCRSFQYESSPDFEIKKIAPTETCLLSLAADPLQWITQQLQHTVLTRQGKIQQLKLHNRCWHLQMSDASLQAKSVILATGAEPQSLFYPGIEEITLDIALDPDKLAQACNKEDTVAVFGSSHSALLIMKTLIEMCDLKKVINFYLSPLRYAVYYDDWILFDNTGLKGNAALWARQYIDGQWPAQLERVISNEEHIRKTLPLCTKAIYATGFKKRIIPIEGMPTLTYNDRNGIIAPGLFGLGIAFPEAKMDHYGILEHRVGLWKFMEYLNSILPVWLTYGT